MLLLRSKITKFVIVLSLGGVIWVGLSGHTAGPGAHVTPVTLLGGFGALRGSVERGSETSASFGDSLNLVILLFSPCGVPQPHNLPYMYVTYFYSR